MDIAGFLGRYAPFDALAPEHLAAVARTVEVAHFPAGEVILRQDGPPAEALHVVRKGSVELVDDGVVLDLLGEGEVFGQFSLLAHAGPSLTVRAHEDTLCYLLLPPAANEVLGGSAGVSFVIGSMRQRVLAALSPAHVPAPDPRLAPAGSLVRRPPVTAPPQTTATEAAAKMTREKVSSLLVPLGQGWGIVTDRDLRSRILAVGGGVDTPIQAIATTPVRTVSSDDSSGEALLMMLEAGVHHLPVTEGGRIVGVVTDTDLMGLGRHTPFALRSAIERAGTADAVASAAADLPQVVVTLVRSNADPFDVGRVCSMAIEAATDRLTALAIHELGDPPAPWAWLALGSAARREQSLKTDQDHALAFDPSPGADLPECDAYFASLAGFVTDGLERAGIPRCRGDAMAIHPQMRRTLADWAASFRAWMDDPVFEAGVLSSIGFDFRRVSGPLDADPALDEAVREGRGHLPFVRMLGRKATSLKPPTGFFRDLVVQGKGEHAGRLDVKHGGITIITNLARCWGVQAGAAAKATPARLRSAVGAGLVDEAFATELEQAFRFLWDVRLRHQAAQVEAGEEPDDFVDPGKLGAFQRAGLKEAFRAIVRAQRLVASDLGLDLR